MQFYPLAKDVMRLHGSITFAYLHGHRQFGIMANAAGIDIPASGISVRNQSIPVQECVLIPVPDWFRYRHF